MDETVTLEVESFDAIDAILTLLVCFGGVCIGLKVADPCG